jgi:hypothetical protein
MLSGATVQYRLWRPAQSSSSPVDLGVFTRQPLMLIHLMSTPRSLIQRFLGRPRFFLLYTSSYRIFLCIRWSSIRCTWPSQMVLPHLTNLTMSPWPRMDLVSCFDVSLHSPFRKTAPQILLTIRLSKDPQRLVRLQFSGSRVHIHMSPQVL